MHPPRSNAGDGLAPVVPIAGLPGPQEVKRLASLISQGKPAEVVSALGVAAELGVTGQLSDAVLHCCASCDVRVRAKATMLLGGLPQGEQGGTGPVSAILHSALGDADHRVRASAIETVERLGWECFDEILEARSRHGHQRERANAIKALLGRGASEARQQLVEMLLDRRDGHRLSALWVVETRRMSELVEQVARIARSDANVRVRNAASFVLREILRQMLGARRGQHGRAVA